MITTPTTMMTDVVVVPSFEGLLEGCMLLTGTVLVVVTIPTVWGGEVITDVVVAPSLEGLLVGCVLLQLTGAVVEIAPTLCSATEA